MNRIRRVRSGVEITLDGDVASLLAQLVTHVDAILEPPPAADPLETMVGLRGQAPPVPDDPAEARLLPEAYRDDDKASADFRRRASDDLRSTKRDAAQAVLTTIPTGGGKVLLTDGQVDAWLRALTDARLVLGTHLDLADDEAADELEYLADTDPRRPMADTYLFLGQLQESLVQVLL
ncbi:MAG: DUF2017 domain-containing protein [Frankia sp.]